MALHEKPTPILPDTPYALCITSLLSTSVRILAPVIGIQNAKAFLRDTGGNVEIFLPFYNWHGKNGTIRPTAFSMFRFFRQLYGAKGLRVMHAGYADQKFLTFKKRFFLNIADPRSREENVRRLRSELAVIKKLRHKYSIATPVLYVLHFGRVEKGISRSVAHETVVSVVRDIMPDAQKSGVCITTENVYSMSGYEHVGVLLPQVGDILHRIGTEWVDRGVLGWTFDLAHALLAYQGNYNAIERDLLPILPLCVHVHVNHPRTIRSRSGKALSKWGRGDDYHVAPVIIPRRELFWNLLRSTIVKSRIPQWKTLTYEVGLEVPVLHSLTGGSSFREVRLGYSALNRFCNHQEEAFDVDAICRYLDRHG